MELLTRFTEIATSQHAGRALKAARVLSFVGTVRGVVTTVLVLAGAAGGAATVNTVVQQELAPSIERQSAPSVVPTATPLTAAGIRLKAQSTLQTALTNDTKAADDLRKIALLSGAPLDQLIADTKQQLRQRYDQGFALIGTLLEPADAAADAAPSSSALIVVNALVQVINADLNRIVVRATQTATGRAGSATPVQSTASQPVTAVSTVHADAAAKLEGTLAADKRSADDLATFTTLSGPRVVELIADTKRKLQSRYDEGLSLLDTLAGDPSVPPSALAVASLVQLITNDLHAILRKATQLATAPTPPSSAPQAPAVVPPPVGPPHLPAAAPRTPTPAPGTATPAPRTPTPAPVSRTPTTSTVAPH